MINKKVFVGLRSHFITITRRNLGETGLEIVSANAYNSVTRKVLI